MTMPETITTPDGQTFIRTRYTGTALPPAEKHGIREGETLYEYWLDGRDTCRLHAADPQRWFID